MAQLKSLYLPSRGLQQTLTREVLLEGHGIHSGLPVRVRLLPADPDSGLVFVRRDLPGAPAFRAQSALPIQSPGCMTLNAHDGVQVRMMEHLLAVTALLELDNLRIELTAEELPILDGSAAPILEAITTQSDIKLQNRPIHALVIEEAFALRRGESWAEFTPGEGFTLEVSLEFPGTDLHAQHFTYRQGDTPPEALAHARTFCLASELEDLFARGLAKGGNLDNALVIGPNGPLEGQALRFPDEPVRHKTLDALGDLRVLEHWFEGHIRLHRPGHAFHAWILTQLKTLWPIPRTGAAT